MKKFILMIPLLIVMLLNCVCYGQVAYAAENIDYSEQFRDVEEYIPELLDVLDITDIESLDFNPDYSEYFLFSLCPRSYFEAYMNGGQFFFNVYILDLSESSFTDNGISYSSDNKINYVRRDYYFERGSLALSGGTTSTAYFCFSPDSGYLDYNSSSAITPVDDVTLPLQYVLHLDTNSPDFGNNDVLDVSVTFSPELTGAFSRTVLQNGHKVTLDTLNFTVTNNSKFPIQYMVAIVNRDEDFFVYNDNNSYSAPNGKVFGGNPSYVYVKDEWLYLPSGETKRNVTSAYAPSSWHYVSSKASDSVTVGFNQMKLNIGVYYDVYVYAIRNDSSQVLCIPYNRDSWQYNEDYVIDFTSAQLVYSSEFTISNPAEFDPTANDGSYAFDIDDRLLFNRANGYIDENGNVVIDRVDTDSFIGGSDSWGSQFDSDAWENYYTKQNTVSADIDQLSNNFSSFFKFINKTFSYFPKNYQNIIILGLTAVVVLGVLKVVF